MDPFPLQALDKFLLNYHVGHALLAAFALAMLGSLPLKSRKVLSLNAITFGAIFLLTPSSMAPIQYKFLGITLLVIGPMLYVTARR